MNPNQSGMEGSAESNHANKQVTGKEGQGDCSKRISRRTLLASLGLTGAAVVSGGMLHTINAGKQSPFDQIGDLAELETTEKSSLVGAINENASRVASAAGEISDLGVNVAGYVHLIPNRELIPDPHNWDWTAAIQQALNDGSGGKVIFPRGVYSVTDTLHIPAGTQIEGRGKYDSWGSSHPHLGTVIRTVGSGTPRIFTDIREDRGDKALTVLLFGLGSSITIRNLTLLTGTQQDAWDAGLFLPTVKQCAVDQLSTFGSWQEGAIYLDATWSANNTYLRGLHPDVEPDDGMNEFSATNCYITGGTALRIQGTTRDPDQYSSAQWVWSPSGASDIWVSHSRLGTEGGHLTSRERGATLWIDGATKSNSLHAIQGQNFSNCSFRAKYSRYNIHLDRTARSTFVNCYGEATHPNDLGFTPGFSLTDRTYRVSRVNDRIIHYTEYNGEIVSTSILSTTWAQAGQRMFMFKTDNGGAIQTSNIEAHGDGSSRAVIFRSFGDLGIVRVARGLDNYLRIGTDALHPDGPSSTVMNLGTYTNHFNTVTARWFRPHGNGANPLGAANFRFSEVFAATGQINTSDEREKQQIGAVPEEWLDAWAEVEFYRFKYNEAVERKGSGGARWHVGVIAQRVQEAFARRGIDAFEIGLLTYDEWDDVFEEQAAEYDDEGRVVREAERTLVRKAGSLYGIRADECQFLEMALSRRETNKLRRELELLKSQLG